MSSPKSRRPHAAALLQLNTLWEQYQGEVGLVNAVHLSAQGCCCAAARFASVALKAGVL